KWSPRGIIRSSSCGSATSPYTPIYRRLSFTAAHFVGWAPDYRVLGTSREFLAIALNALFEFRRVGRPAFLACQLRSRAELTDRGCDVVDATRVYHIHN